MKIVFMGTPAFAVPSLMELIKLYDVVAVVTQPDKPKGRGHQMLPSPIKEAALANGIAVIQPQKVKTPEAIEAIRAFNADMIVVVAFGQILPKEILDMPPLGCINVHGSILPKYRGAAPMQWAVINGETQTGITTMYMAQGLDSGDMLIKQTLDITPEDTYGTVYEKMQTIGAQTLIKTIEAIKNGTITPITQCHEDATYAPMITKETGRINWNASCNEIINLIRGLNPAPNAYTLYDGEVIKIWQAEAFGEACADKKYGEIIAHHKKGFVVNTKDGGLLIKELQAKGGKRMEAGAYLRGHSMPVGSILS